MPLVVADRVWETTSTSGTGTLTLSGAVSGYQTFAAIGNGNTTYYTITNGTNFEVGIGTYTVSGTTLSRDTVLTSSLGGTTKINVTPGSFVFVDYPAEKAVYEDASNIVTVPTLAIDAPTTDATLSNNTSVTGWVFSGKSVSVSAQETIPQGLFIGLNGTKMYVCGSAGDDVNEYTLGTAYDVSTATFTAVSTGVTQDTVPVDVFFKEDGLTMFVLGQTNKTVFQYTLSVAGNITTATYASKSFSVNSQETAPTGLWFKYDGTTMYIVGTTNDTVFQYTLSTPWDISTASYASISFSVASQESNPQQVNLSADGTEMYVIGSTGDDINEYDLGTAYDIGTATFVNNVYVGFQAISPTGLFIDSTAPNRVYIVDNISDTVFQYNTATNAISATTDRFFVSGETYSKGNFYASGNAVVNLGITAGTGTFGTTTISGTLTSTSTTNLATATGAQTVSLGAGATTSGSLKTLNIGTAGVSGSTTAINIGSAVSGATSKTTLSGLVINSISAAVSAAGATQGTATALVSNINNVAVVAAAADGVRLPTAVAGLRILIRNSDAVDTLKIYPATGGQINALGTNASFSLVAGATIEIFATTATQLFTF